MKVCARSWGTPGTGWTFCTLDRGHAGECCNKALGAKPPAALFFEQQPEALAEIEKQIADEQRSRAKKAAVKPAPAPGRSRYID